MPGAVCPECQEAVRLPSVDPASEVRCPWCHATYPLADALQKLPPMLEVVHESLAMPDSAESGFVSPGLSGFEFTRSSLAPELDRFPIDRAPLKRRRSGSPVLGVVKIALGGLAGCLIALVILQSMARLPDLGFWPFRGPGAKFWGNGFLGTALGEREEGRFRRGGWQGPPGNDARRAEAGGASFADTENAPRLGAPEELELPAFPAVESPELTPVAKWIGQIEAAVLKYEQEKRGADALDQPFDEQRALVAKELVQLLESLSGELSMAAGLMPQEKSQLEAIVMRLGKDVPLLKLMLPAGWEKIQSVEGSKPSVVVIGMLGEVESGWQLMRSSADKAPIKIEMESTSGLSKNRTAMVLGTIENVAEENQLKVHFLGWLKP